MTRERSINNKSVSAIKRGAGKFRAPISKFSKGASWHKLVGGKTNIWNPDDMIWVTGTCSRDVVGHCRCEGEKSC